MAEDCSGDCNNYVVSSKLLKALYWLLIKVNCVLEYYSS